MDFKKSLVLNDPGDYPVFLTFEVVDIISEFFGRNQGLKVWELGKEVEWLWR